MCNYKHGHYYWVQLRQLPDGVYRFKPFIVQYFEKSMAVQAPHFRTTFTVDPFFPEQVRLVKEVEVPQ